ncbi:PucR family transcriptional regulator [Streptomyces rubiginosohelvolus]|uniref:PucR family transcriptional regulator n=1 Tax=Streptomyces rubiginosohelvolus TaxID=67362 RepID=UPI00367D6FEF
MKGYADLGDDPRLFDALHTTLTMCLDRCCDETPYTAADLQTYAAVGEQKAKNALTLPDLQEAFQVAHVEVLRSLLSLAEHGDDETIRRYNTWLANETPRVVHATVTAFNDMSCHLGIVQPARHVLAEHLIQGTATGTEANVAGVELPQGFLVLMCHAPQPMSADDRQMRLSVEQCLQSVPGALWLGSLHRDKLITLLPVNGDETSAQLVAGELVKLLAEVTGQRIHAAQAVGRDISAVPDAVDEARQAIRLIAAMPDAQPRPYQTEELLVELALASDAAVRQRLSDLLVPLDQGTGLRHTLEVLFECGLDREKSAQALYIHRRTLTFRLQRIREILGIDPNSPHGIQLLRAALTAARFSSA